MNHLEHEVHSPVYIKQSLSIFVKEQMYPAHLL